MPKTQQFYCSACKIKHERPVGRNCTRNLNAATASLNSDRHDVSIVSTSSRSSTTSMSTDLGHKILQSLNSVQEQLQSLDARVQKNEEAVAARPVSAEPKISSPKSSQNSDLNPALPSLATPVRHLPPGGKCGPSLEYVRHNEGLRSQVNNRMSDLQGENQHTSGKIVSQRGGPGEVKVKKNVDWPQHFVFVGLHSCRCCCLLFEFLLPAVQQSLL